RAYYAERYYQTERGSYRKSYSAGERRFFEVKIAQRARLARALRGTEAPGRMLDVGCGEGFALASFAAEGWRVEGIHYSSAGVAAMHPELAGRVAVGDVGELLEQRIAQGHRYDLVWLMNVLEHVLDPVALLERLRRIVADGGLLVVVVPNDGTRYQAELLAA